MSSFEISKLMNQPLEYSHLVLQNNRLKVSNFTKAKLEEIEKDNLNLNIIKPLRFPVEETKEEFKELLHLPERQLINTYYL